MESGVSSIMGTTTSVRCSLDTSLKSMAGRERGGRRRLSMKLTVSTTSSLAGTRARSARKTAAAGPAPALAAAKSAAAAAVPEKIHVR
jgi:hypothetical protein